MPHSARTSSPHKSRARSASRPTRWARTTCRHSGAAISWPSPTRGRMPRPSDPPTTGVRARRRSCAVPTAASRSVAGAAPSRPSPESSMMPGMHRHASRFLLSVGTAIALLLPIAVAAAGPPFPEPVDGQAVYDTAGILSEDAIADAEATIDAIETRTAAEIVVYTQLVDYGVTTEETESRARALIDQWGVGRRGFDDGLAIFFDIDPSLEHGQVQLYAAPGFEATFLTNSERHAIFDDDMLPFLRNADFDGALGVALDRIDAAATPENAARLETGRQVNAVLGLIGAPIAFMGLAGWAFMQWRRFGKDPVYLDDPSILMPAPPPDLTAASGAFVMDGGTSRRALTTAMLDIASRGLISFREDRGLLGLSNKVGIDVGPPTRDPVEEARRALNARRPIGPAEEYALKELRELASGEDEGYIDADDLPKFGTSVSTFDSKLESHVVKKGWMVEKPSKVVSRWTGKGVLVIIAGGIALFAGINIPIAGLVMIGAAAIAGGIVILGFARGMPAVTMPGAMIRAMLAAYRRTLQ